MWLAGAIARGGIPHATGSETYAPQAPWAAPGWLGALTGSALIHAGGFGAMALASAVLVCLAFGALEVLARERGASPNDAAFAGLLAFPACADALRAGSLLAALAPAPIVAVIGLALARRRPAVYPAFAAIATALWCNMSACGLFAPAIFAGIAAGRRSRGAYLGAAAAVAASFATPGGWLFVTAAAQELKLDAILELFESPNYDQAPYPIGAALGLPLGAVLLAICARTKRSVASLFAIAGSMAAIVANAAYLPLLGFVSVAVALPEAGAIRRTGRTVAAVAAVLATYAFVLVLDAERFHAANLRYADESSLVATARAQGAHRLLCTLVVWCDESLTDGLAVYVDDRWDAHPRSVYRDVYRLRYLTYGWPAAMRRAAPDALIVARTEPPVQILGSTAGWRVAACTPTACLILKRHS